MFALRTNLVSMFVRNAVQRHANDHEAVTGLGLQSDQIWNLRDAGGAPGGPEIQEDDLATQIGQPKRLALKVLKGKVGHRRAGGFRNVPAKGQRRNLGIVWSMKL